LLLFVVSAAATDCWNSAISWSRVMTPGQRERISRLEVRQEARDEGQVRGLEVLSAANRSHTAANMGCCGAKVDL